MNAHAKYLAQSTKIHNHESAFAIMSLMIDTLIGCYVAAMLICFAFVILRYSIAILIEIVGALWHIATRLALWLAVGGAALWIWSWL